jgi:hypothetical protein
MADKIKAIYAYSPRIKQGLTVDMDRLVSLISRRSGLNQGTILNVLMELRDAFVYHSKVGEAVKLDGLGTFTPTIGLEGEVKMKYRMDNWLKNLLNAPGEFKGELENKDMIGKTVEELVARWNEEHPDDKVEEKVKKEK